MPNTPQTLRLGILGMGAIGTLMAWHWRQHSVCVLGRTPGTSCHRQLTLLDQTTQTFTLPSWQEEALDWLVVTTKATQTLDALAPWQGQLKQVKRLLLLQNGMGQQEEVEQWLQHHQLTCDVWLGISTEGAFRSSSEQVVYAGEGQTVIGPVQAQYASSVTLPPRLQRVDNIQQRQRDKLAINAILNPLTGHLRCHNGELVNNPDYQPQLLALATEVQSLYQHIGWYQDSPSVPNLIERSQQVATATARNKSSTLQDILAERPTELPYICGYLLDIAQQHDSWPMPITQRLYRELQLVP